MRVAVARQLSQSFHPVPSATTTTTTREIRPPVVLRLRAPLHTSSPTSSSLASSSWEHYSGKMAVTYAAAITTPCGGLRQPQIQARACSDPDMRASFEASVPTPSRGSEHKPNTGHEEEHVYVLTLKLSDSLARPMDELRNRYFPKRLNRTGAHLTLFHALPESHMEVLEQGLAQISGTTKPFDVSSGKPFRMRKGVGINVDEGYQKMKDVHSDLQSQWSAFLSEQDAGGFRPHWTVMNKVDDKHKVDGAFSTIRQELSEGNQEGRAVGLDLWRYERGNWIFAKEFWFGEAAKTPTKANASVSPGSRGTGLSSPGDQSPGGGPGRRPGMFKRGSSVGNALRSMSFRKRS